MNRESQYETNWGLVVLLAVMFLAIAIMSLGHAHADYGQVKIKPEVEYGQTVSNIPSPSLMPVDVCVFRTLDTYMDQNLPGLLLSNIPTKNSTIISIKDQLTDNYNCVHIIKIDRAINQNYYYTNHNIKYQVYQNTATIFTYKTSQVYSPSSGGGNANSPIGDNKNPRDTGGTNFKPMTNWSCETEAHSNKYFDNYGFNELYPHFEYCDPYLQTDKNAGELPYNIIESSLNKVMTVWGYKN